MSQHKKKRLGNRFGPERKLGPEFYTRISWGKHRFGIRWSRGYISNKYRTRYDLKLNKYTGEYWIINTYKDQVVKQGKIRPDASRFMDVVVRYIKRDLRKLGIRFNVRFRKARKIRTKAETNAQTSDRTAMGTGESGISA